jgi:lipopolysaccharide/colanic/teichoic acid biosynthesis glycosyltransferase
MMSVKLFPPGVPIEKRLFDIFLTTPGLILISPLLLAFGFLLRFKMGRPVIFRQHRPGYKGTPFAINKFRTMNDMRDADGHLLPDAKRLTGLGRFMRATSLDELPELINVLRGEMSLVGPGITGWAQVNGRNALTWEDKFRLDVWYVDHWSLWLDIKIVAMTMLKVIRREGISQPGYASMEEFMGSGLDSGCNGQKAQEEPR